MSERHVTVDIIIAAVSAVTGVDRLDILSGRRDAETSRARIAVVWLASKMVAVSSGVLGRILGNRDHTSILYLERRADEMRAAEPLFRLDTDTMLGALLAIDRNGLIRLAQTIDPLATARRVLAHPARESVRVSSHEIIALCQVALAVLGDDPTEPDPSEPAQEIEHAA
ncbi:helix-turn-helix domain-containing protein [Bosea vaviloviae]|uniref:helix-turn-helix domain-containing protein n=1 Tax=Bosea vaviloviae TaxID=1526658 RepID=UPI0006BA7712|nr:helix-turn-helix domain-containing protein [Bosea vaviloviae]